MMCEEELALVLVELTEVEFSLWAGRYVCE
jgi:hypothetical protein